VSRSYAAFRARSILPSLRRDGATIDGSDMNHEVSGTPHAGPGPRTRISCPGCGRNDHVTWPAGQDTFHWTCFNCGKSFDLKRPSTH
jgi:hypothetical protein